MKFNIEIDVPEHIIESLREVAKRHGKDFDSAIAKFIEEDVNTIYEIQDYYWLR